MGLVIGKIKGYSVCTITKGTLKKGEFFEEIEVKEPKIKEKAIEIVENKGIIYGLKKDKKLKAIYLFNSKHEDDGEVLLFIEKILLDEISEEVISDEGENIYNQYIYNQLIEYFPPFLKGMSLQKGNARLLFRMDISSG